MNKERVPKILLMGKAGVGKTSMRSIIFANCAPRDTFVLGYTNEVAEIRMRFMGNMMLNLYDCGGQNEFIKQYLESKREQIFGCVEVLVFVIEAERSKHNQNNDDLTYYEDCIKALTEFSPEAKVVVLIHKMDLVADHRKQIVFEKRQKEIKERSINFSVKCFPTSIWEVTLYKAWTDIVSTLIMDMDSLKSGLVNFSSACNADEVILFEKSTFLLTCFHSKNNISDDQRFEKISHIIKKFKLSCINNKAQFQSLVIKTKGFTTYLEEFTKSTYIMITLQDKNVNLNLLKLNIDLAKGKMEEIIFSVDDK
jgi:Ras-related GTP-binding protein A/B